MNSRPDVVFVRVLVVGYHLHSAVRSPYSIGRLFKVPSILSTMAKRRHSDRKSIDDEFGLEFALEELRGSEAPKNKEILLHLFFFLKRDGRGQKSSGDAAKEVIKSIKAQWVGSGVALASDPTLQKRVDNLYQLYR